MTDACPYSGDDVAFAEALLAEGASFDAVHKRLQDQGVSPEAALAIRNDLYLRAVSVSAKWADRPFLSAREYDDWAQSRGGPSQAEASDNRDHRVMGGMFVVAVPLAVYIAGGSITGVVGSGLLAFVWQLRRQGSWPFS